MEKRGNSKTLTRFHLAVPESFRRFAGLDASNLFSLIASKGLLEMIIDAIEEIL